MNDIDQLEAFYLNMQSNLSSHFPDGIIDVDVQVLHALELLPSGDTLAPCWTHSFHVIEHEEKITLFNQSFAAWIIPLSDSQSTTVAIARRANKSIIPEIAFSLRGIHNQSRTILSLIEKSLNEIEETEDCLDSLQNSQ